MPSKFEELRKIVGDRVAIAFSGGVDSATLAALCRKWGIEAIAVTVKTDLMAARDLENAKRVAEEIGIEHVIVEVAVPDAVLENTPQRCYYCKKTIIKAIKDVAESRGFRVIDGTNADDLKDFRPGLKALEEEGVISPWAMAGFTKKEIRRVAKSLGLSVHNRPSNSCLATRIPFGERIEVEWLRRIEGAEEAVIDIIGERRIRVRKYGKNAAVEIEGIEEINDKKLEAIESILKKLGFESITFSESKTESKTFFCNR
ncbi:ATP-dependent sacrificial sulfur transferase LarE [Archaeoglobus veneficus]|uniref:Asparagine synthetase domain-containing protein n=1 Tax=Archaeoglobus veneficus (strain DSM 11195 / SNP6) TaxID=693661 RepID=F2KNC2_ARCVS|nr:ATP-dependent sacrificial sulfur transferase LarE [Archaeoglobus veneficus]AEA47324.1 Conserved hypothetical protein CHP00268 [Archaeoglobus veneficus SNP6]